MAPERTILGGMNRLMVSVVLDTVSVQIVCPGVYDAQVLFEDLVDRLRRGEAVTLTPSPGTKNPPA